jgi:hypothetical protein
MTITINHNHYIHGFDDEVKKLLHQIIQKLTKMGQELDDLKAAVAKNTEVEQSAVTLITGLKEKLDAAIASGDPAQLTALSTELGSSSDALAAAVTANTPADTANNG